MRPDLLNAIDSDFVELRESERLSIDLRYASTNNFVGENLYGAFNKAFPHKVAAKKLEQAIDVLSQLAPGYGMLIFDALRPRSAQYVLWNKVKGTDHEQYIADPDIGSVHNFGFAIDLTLLDKLGAELDMGTGFDNFTPLAH